MIIDFERSVKTKAVNFEQVVIVKNDDNYKIHYARKAGIILVTDENDEVVSELVEIVPKENYK